MAKKVDFNSLSHEKLVEDFVQRLIDSYGYTQDMIELNYDIVPGVLTDIAIWQSTEDKRSHTAPDVCVVVVCKPEHVRIEAEHYFERYLHVKMHAHHFFIANNLKETKVFYRENDNLNTLIPIGDFPKASDMISDAALDRFILKMKNNDKDALLSAFSRCHSIIRNNDKLSPESAFDEISKIIFIKMLYERSNPEGELIYNEDKFEKDSAQSKALNYIDELFAGVKNKYPDLFDTYDHIRISRRSFTQILKELEIVDFYDTTEDIKGIAFEAFLGKTFRGELGQFFTPRTIVNFMVESLDIREGELVCDPCCGSGGFLIKAFDYIQKIIEADIDSQIKAVQSKKGLNDSKKKEMIVSLLSELDRSKTGSRMYKLCNNYLFGVDANPRMARTSKMNMIMHGDGHVGVFLHDGLTDNYTLKEGMFDVVLINPPYGVHIDRTQVDENNQPIDKLYDIKGGYAEDLFVERTIKLLKPGGRAGLVLPEGIMTNKNKEKVRKYVERYAKILNITSIPSDVFLASGANVKPSLLFIQKYNIGEKTSEELAVSKVTDAGINSLGLPSNNEQLEKLAPIVKEWITKRERTRSDMIKYIHRSEMVTWNVPACFNALTCQFNPQYSTSRLYEILTLSQNMIEVSDDEVYSRVTVKLFNKGLSERDRVKGENIGTKKQNKIKAGQFVISKIDGKSGAFGIVPESLDGAIVTPDFLVFDVDTNRINVEYLMLVLNSDMILSQYAVSSSGSTGRKRLQTNIFLNTVIPLASMSEQDELVKNIVLLREKKDKIEQEIESQIDSFHNIMFKR